MDTQEHGRKTGLKEILWIVVILSPILAGILLGWITGTSIFNLEAWNTANSDEVGYYHAVMTMREIGKPTGINSCNEVTSDLLAYGEKNYVTYGILFLLSFLTGWAGHNMIVFANVLLMMLVYGIVILLLRPSVRESCCLLLFSALNLLFTRYTWSGMNEAVCCAISIVTVSMSFWLFRCDFTKNDRRSRFKIGSV